jgi:hypothetical protein
MDFTAFMTTEVGKYLLIAIIATLIPSPIDPINFYLQNWLYTHRQKRFVFEAVQIFSWYFLDTLWFVFLFGLAFILGINNVSTANIMTITMAILGIGATISILWRFLSKKGR